MLTAFLRVFWLLKMHNVGINLFRAGHVVSEAYIEDLGKWVMLDGQWDVIPVLDGQPLSALELQQALAQEKEGLDVISLSGADSADYFGWIKPYLFYMDTGFDQRVGNEISDRRKGRLMLVPEGSRHPVQFLFASPCEELIIKYNTLTGAVIKNHGEIQAKIVVDATGRHAFVRNNLPPSMGMPPLKTRPGRMFTVYMEEWECAGDFPKGSNTYVCYKGFANQLRENTTLVGASTLQGRSGSEEMHRRLVAHHLPGVKHKVLNKYSSAVPYDFPPHHTCG